MGIVTYTYFGDVLIFFITLLLVCFIYYKFSFTYWTKKGVPIFEPSFPFGNLTDVIFGRCSFTQAFDKAYNNLKPKGLKYVGFYFFTKPVFVPLDLELIKSILVKDFSYFTDRSFYINKEQDPLSAHLFALKGTEWKKMREKLTVTFTTSKLKMLFETLKNCSDGLLPLIQDAVVNSEVIDIGDITSRFTTDTIASCGFGVESNTLKEPHSEFRRHGERFVGREGGWDLIKVIIGSFCPEILVKLKISVFAKEMQDFFIDLVRNTIKYREENNIKRRDFMHLLIQLKNNVKILEDESLGSINAESDNIQGNSKDSLTVEDLAAQTILFYLAGFETSATTITFCMLELCLNQEIQNKVRQEIVSVLKENDHNITYSTLSKMTYLECCIQETLRKYPPLANLFRECTKDYNIPGTDVIIKKGISVYIPLYNLHRDPEYHDNPEFFDPERFNAENLSGIQSYSSIPFGEGPRMCIGVRFAMIQVKVALIRFLKDYRYTVNRKTKLPIQIDPQCFTTAALGGVWLNAVQV